MGTATFSNVQRISIGGSMACLATFNGSASYATNGDDLDTSTLPFQFVDNINFSDPVAANAYLLAYVPATSKAKTYTLTGSITGGTVDPNSAGTPSGGVTLTPTLNEVIAVAANIGTLLLQPSIVQNVYVTAGGSTGAFTIIPGGTAPGAGEVAIDSNAASLTFNAGDAVTAASVTYMNRGAGFLGAPLGNHDHNLSGLSGSSSIAEVGNATNLSGLTCQCIVFGHN